MRQHTLPFGYDDPRRPVHSLSRTSFSHEGVSPEAARVELERRYKDLLQETDEFDRRLVSYQGNKGELLHSWIKYREGFSAQLVETLLRKFNVQPGETVLDPFAGSATTLLAAKMLGINGVGIELLPVCHLAWDAKSLAFEYSLDELNEALSLIRATVSGPASRKFPHLVITESAFPPEAENDLMFFTEMFETSSFSAETKTLLRLVLTGILEEVSYTRKDGQYLRWDSRAEKVERRNKARASNGRPPIKGMNKGELPSVKQALIQALCSITEDLEEIHRRQRVNGAQHLIKGNTLEVLPTLESDQFAAVITSPPYCNRYDYTRTYALELAYLGCGEDGVRELRQGQLSCTVENRSKVSTLEKHYRDLGLEERFEHILSVVEQNPAFIEVNTALQMRQERRELNNAGVLPMVRGYFTELAFVFAELFRTCKSGAFVAFVNDNVRYGGEVIPVDTLTTNLAEQLGFKPVKIYVLAQRKGNSSQQMKKFGREPLRKSITIWQKP